MNIEFDQKKAASNLKKHGVSFDEAATALLDPMALVREDDDALHEARFVAVGISNAGRLITARKATNNEQRQYEN